MNPTSTASSVESATAIPPNLTITARIDHVNGTVTIVATVLGEDGRPTTVSVLPRTEVADSERAATTCTIAAPGASNWSIQSDATPRTWPAGVREYAYDTTTDLRVRVLARSETEARQEVLVGAGDFMELFCELGPLLVTTGSVQTIDELVEVVDQDGNAVPA